MPQEKNLHRIFVVCNSKFYTTAIWYHCEEKCLTAGHKNKVDNIESEDGGARQRWAAAPSTSALHFNYISFLPSCQFLWQPERHFITQQDIVLHCCKCIENIFRMVSSRHYFPPLSYFKLKSLMGLLLGNGSAPPARPPPLVIGLYYLSKLVPQID